MDSDDLLKVGLVLLAVFVLFPLFFGAVFLPSLAGFGHVGMGIGGVGLLFWLAASLLPLLVLLGVGYLLYTVVTGDDEDRAIEELRAAYARGELTDEEFENRYDRLTRTDGADDDW
ncbi:putative membrane protein [Halovivax ruber XH-70]|uniref:Putative membrane protein n=1 Tax=Halovivax ruber (strain DSM 18193 / JCM 13892 / XH-70) TaxID=797302 RepID=L0IH80_HALRX|nr:SHOCT domain-containing protein [Halovivax ruber]AGB17312.1 putative membrane protein [Halovivax ruber XH-70]